MALQWGLEYRTFEYRVHSKTEHFEGPFWNGGPFENRPFEIRMMASLDHFVYKEIFDFYTLIIRVKGG